MITILKNYKLVVPVALLAFIASCTKPVDLQLSPKQDYFVYGEVSNTYSRIFISELITSELSLVRNASVYIEENGNRHDFQLTDSLFEMTDVYIEPSSPYQLVVELAGKKMVYNGQLPDTVKKVELKLNHIKDFRYEFKLDVDVDESSKEYGFIWGPINYQYEPISYGRGLSYAYEAAFLEKFASEEFYVARTNPLIFNTDYQANIKRVYAKTIDAFDLDFEIAENRFNPLYLKYNPLCDVVIENAVFRIYEMTNIKTNVVRVEDTTPILMECNIYTESGSDLSAETYQNLRFNVSFADDRNPSTYIPMNINNPTTISLNQLSYLLNWSSNEDLDLDFNDLLNRPLRLWILGTDTDGRRVGALQDVTLTDLAETKKLTIRLEKE